MSKLVSKVRVGTMLKPSNLRALKELSAREGKSISDLLDEAVEQLAGVHVGGRTSAEERIRRVLNPSWKPSRADIQELNLPGEELMYGE